MENVFIKLIYEGKIHDLEELKKAFRKIAKKTHPDLVGSDDLVEKFIEFKKHFEEAKALLSSDSLTQEEDEVIIVEENYRFLFFQALQRLDTLEMPHNKNNKKIEEVIKVTNEELFFYFRKWGKNSYKMFLAANKEYEIIKKEKPKNDIANLRKPSLYYNLKPIFFNLSNYHITGLEFYLKQLKRNLNPIILRLEENSYFSLKEYLLFLINDIEKGPAVFE